MLDVDARHRDLWFLLGLAPLALGCSVGASDDGPQFTSSYPGTPPGGEEGSAEGDTGGGSGSGGGSSGANTIGDPDDGVSVSASVSVGDDGSTSGASASASVSVSASASASATYGMTSYDYTSGGPPPGGSGCQAYGYLLAGCYYGGDPAMAASFTQNCEMALAYYQLYYGPACASAFEEAVACLSQLSCQQLPMYGNGLCDAEAQALAMTCI